MNSSDININIDIDAEPHICHCNKIPLSHILYEMEPNTNLILVKNIEICSVSEYNLDSKLENFEPTGHERCKYFYEEIIDRIENENEKEQLHEPETYTQGNNNNNNNDNVVPLFSLFVADRKDSTFMQLNQILYREPTESVDEYIERFKQFILDTPVS
jgi:hypothetical protein